MGMSLLYSLFTEGLCLLDRTLLGPGFAYIDVKGRYCVPSAQTVYAHMLILSMSIKPVCVEN